MKPYYQDLHNTLYNTDFRKNDLPDESVQCVVTSPPYWGLRKYSGEQELIWGDNHCEHQWGEKKVTRKGHPGTKSTLVGTQTAELSKAVDTLGSTCILCGAWKCAYGLEPTPEMYIEHTIEILREIRRVLRKDGVCFIDIGDSYMSSPSNMHSNKVGGKGLENIGRQKRTPSGSLKSKDLCLIPFKVALEAQKPYQEFTIKDLPDRAWLAGIIDADGCIGIHHYERKWKDSTYHQFQPFISVGSGDVVMVEQCVSITRMNGTHQITRPPVDSRGIRSNRPHYEWRVEGENAAKILEDIYPHLIVKEKQARLAHAVWRSNQETKGGKSNPIPLKVTEYRLTLWETIKKCNQREDATVTEPPVPQHIELGWWVRSVIIWSKPNPMPESVTDRPTESHEYILMLTKSARYYWDADAVREKNTESTLNRVEYGLKHRHPDNVGIGIPPVDTDRMGERFAPSAGRNIRSVWEFPTQPYPEAHFAVFPEKLPETCIKAATPEVGCCSKCGAPWARVLEKKPSQFNIRVRDAKAGRATPEEGYKATQEEIERYPGNHPDPSYSRTVGWRPTCKCNAPRVPSLVLDPFAGAGTTLWVAKLLNRKAVGYEISEEYCQLAVERMRQQVLL